MHFGKDKEMIIAFVKISAVILSVKFIHNWQNYVVYDRLGTESDLLITHRRYPSYVSSMAPGSWHHFGPDLNYLNNYWMDYGADVDGPQGVNPKYFGDILTFLSHLQQLKVSPIQCNTL